MSKCRLCPRKCGVDRTKSKGFCGESNKLRIGNYQLHQWEEPIISGKNGSGTVFFSGCVMKCVFCQNYEISSLGIGYEITEKRLGEIFLELQEKKAHNINLVNPTHFVPQIRAALEAVKDKLKIPVICNCGGYELPETVELLKGYADIFLPDIKYCSEDLSKRYSNAPDYFETSLKAVRTMVNITGKPIIKNGLLKSGVMVRHLVLPNHRKDSIEIIRRLGKEFAADEILISLMSQYFPTHKAAEFSELARRVSTFEYSSVVKVTEKFGWEGFIQERSSAQEMYVPKFYSEP